MNVGDYVRLSRCQGINRIEEYDEDFKRFELEDVIGDEWGDETLILDENDVIKSSPNIIDLIEVGDYVNGEKVLSVDYECVGIYDFRFIYQNEIKSIVTKQQFSFMEYSL